MVWLFITMEKEKFPAVRQDELVVSVDWNENIDVNENHRRIRELLDYSKDHTFRQTHLLENSSFFLTAIMTSRIHRPGSI